MSIEPINRADATNDLGFRLLSFLTATEDSAGENVFLSSFSIAIALSMAYNGADGEAKEALEIILGMAGSSLKDLNEANETLLSERDTLESKVMLAMANSIWVRDGFTLDPEFVKKIQVHYSGKVANLDFSSSSEASDVINEWIASKTHGKIKNLLTPSDVEPSILILVNAIYFKGIWKDQFDKGRTRSQEFIHADGKRQQVSMMKQFGTWNYSENEMFQGIVLPYGEGRVSLHVLLPKANVPLDTFREYLTLERWREWQSSTEPLEGSLELPRFRARYSKDLVKALVSLGGEGFEEPAFPKMGVGELGISAVIHEAVLEVNEEGAEAAAVTAVTMVRGAVMPSRPFRMVVERPFFCAIYDRKTDMILFMGWILNPE